MPAPFGCKALSALRVAPMRPCYLPSRSQIQNAVRQGLRASGAAATVGLALAGGKPLSFSGGAPVRGVVRASSGGGGGDGDGGSGSGITVTQGLIAINALLYGLQVFSKEALTVWGVKINALILQGQWWRLMTPAFLHGNLVHLAVNCYSLYNLAPVVESVSGGRRLLAVYLAAALAGNVASFYGSAAPSLGASGAVFGIGGALAVYFYRNKELYGKRADMALNQLWQTLLINLLFGLSNARIDNWGHMGGMVGGALAAWLLGPRLVLGGVPGQRGKYLLDVPPVPILASPPRQVGR